jgi:pimeloyl-ACP methyl ester carboxylesterase
MTNSGDTTSRISGASAVVLFLGLVQCGHLAPSSPRVQSVAGDKILPLPGELLRVDGHDAFVILPDSPARPVPWIWYAPTLPGLPGTVERWMFEQFTGAGIAVAGIDVGESYGSPDGRKLFSALYTELTEKRGLSAKPVMLGRSRGGLMALSWAADNPDKVGGFAGIYPVCDIASYPGVEKASGAYHMTSEELSRRLSEQNPIDRLEPLAKAGIPMFAIHGDTDVVVPLEKNSGEMKKRYVALGGQMQLIIPHGQGHNMWEGFFRSKELVDFVVRNCQR